MKNPEQITAAYYNRNATHWATRKNNSFWHEKQFKKFFGYLKTKESVLEIGCAYGIHVPLFLGIGRNLKYEGIDISTSMIRLAKARYPQLSFGFGNIAKKKTLPRKKYDAFWSAATLMHVPQEHWSDMLTNIEHLIKPRGIGYISIPIARPNPPSEKDNRHFTVLNPAQFKKIVTARGWKVLHSGKINNDPDIWRWFIVRLP